MFLVQENILRSIIREEYLRFLSEGKNYNLEIVDSILELKEKLLKRNFICNTQYSPPNPNKKHRDFGYCNIRINTTIGRGTSMSEVAISNLLSKAIQNMNISKYFSIIDKGFDGKYCNCSLRLKPKYVNNYMANIL